MSYSLFNHILNSSFFHQLTITMNNLVWVHSCLPTCVGLREVVELWDHLIQYLAVWVFLYFWFFNFNELEGNTQMWASKFNRLVKQLHLHSHAEPVETLSRSHAHYLTRFPPNFVLYNCIMAILIVQWPLCHCQNEKNK